MNGNNSQMASSPKARTLRELYGKTTRAWEQSTAPIVRFWAENGQCWGFPFFSLVAARYMPSQERLILYWSLGTLGITGPKALEFYDDFANHRATLLKADGKDILSVKLVLNAERAEDAEP
ncbi:MAG: hypothetical protein WB586_26225 [Chthoniobacterales bacterium]